MRIVDYETFIRMPAGTVFCEWEEGGTPQKWKIKTDTGWRAGDHASLIKSRIRWLYVDSSDDSWCFSGVCPLEFDVKEDFEKEIFSWPSAVGEYETEKLYVNDENGSCYEKDQLFCVLNIKELDDMIGWLKWARGQMEKEGESDEM